MLQFVITLSGLPVVAWLNYLSFKHGVLASPWWQRVLLVLPVCVLLWLGVAWALGGQA